MIVAGVQMVAWSFSALALLEEFDLAALEASAPAVSEEAPVVEGASEEVSEIPGLAVKEVVVRVVLRIHVLAAALVV